MKMFKCTLLVLVLTLVGCSAFAAEIDWASMDDATIQAEIANAQAELAKRGGSASGIDGAVLFDVEGVKATVQSYSLDDYVDENDALQIDFVVENNSDKNFEIYVNTSSINGWQVEHVGYIEIEAGHKAKEHFKLLLTDANISTIEEVETVELSFYCDDADYNSYDVPPVTLNFK